jgi:hypothetical protein
MNRIGVVRRQSIYSVGEHLDIAVDGAPLSEALAAVFPEEHIHGLVPCLLPWHGSPEGARELQISLERFLPPPGATTNAPILMCPDDLDFWCTIIIAEVQHAYNHIRWNRVGLNQCEGVKLPEAVGNPTNWMEGFGGWSFGISDYQAVFEAFRLLSRDDSN